MLHCKPAKSIINNSRSDWFSKANTLVWAEPCARWAELKMLSFWAGGISSFPPCAREYRLLRRLRHNRTQHNNCWYIIVKQLNFVLTWIFTNKTTFLFVFLLSSCLFFLIFSYICVPFIYLIPIHIGKYLANLDCAVSRLIITTYK